MSEQLHSVSIWTLWCKDLAATDHPASNYPAPYHVHTGGRIVGQVVRAIVHLSGSTLPVSLSSYAVVGAAAYMGGAPRLTLTATVMVMETTGSLQLIVPLMLTVFVAKVGCVAAFCHADCA